MQVYSLLIGTGEKQQRGPGCTNLFSTTHHFGHYFHLFSPLSLHSLYLIVFLPTHHPGVLRANHCMLCTRSIAPSSLLKPGLPAVASESQRPRAATIIPHSAPHMTAMTLRASITPGVEANQGQWTELLTALFSWLLSCDSTILFSPRQFSDSYFSHSFGGSQRSLLTCAQRGWRKQPYVPSGDAPWVPVLCPVTDPGHSGF